MRANGSAVCTRTIQIDCRANQLNSAFCYILRAPFKIVDQDGLEGKVFVWYGSKSNPSHHDLCLQVILSVLPFSYSFLSFTIHMASPTMLNTIHD